MTILHLIDRCAVAPAFREALASFVRDGRSGERIVFDYGCPPVKVERTIHKLLVEYPRLPIESIEFRASSGCEFFRGRLLVRTADEERRIAFHWDCKWRAEEQGWKDWFGFPDQIRAAREFGWDCFRTWDEEHVAMRAPALFTGEAEAVPA
ncbi:MAG TPA: hypothetical protein VFQ45_16625 [Longimicrobium sp.]|nr:hypothetical protein [Longimicrobium sp.]